MTVKDLDKEVAASLDELMEAEAAALEDAILTLLASGFSIGDIQLVSTMGVPNTRTLKCKGVIVGLSEIVFDGDHTITYKFTPYPELYNGKS